MEMGISGFDFSIFPGTLRKKNKPDGIDSGCCSGRRIHKMDGQSLDDHTLWLFKIAMENHNFQWENPL